ncbi:Ig-like domain-containing protein [Prevotella sp. 10(H)]|uniref:Ig-like domain-containing protein n=1 Tax=Prevotella sp. 10(H) TaxID=1158294 RepID=UPI0006901416|nr:Ig-like domain-containing protein [Prevotella sp. 10(H)]
MNKLLLLLSLVFSLTLFTACGSDDEKEYVIITSLKINQPDKDLYIGDTYQLIITHEPSNVKLPELVWKSSDTKIATVSNTGKLTAIADGVVTITASYGDLTNSITLVISKIQDYTSVVIKNSYKKDLSYIVIGYFDGSVYRKIAECEKIKQNENSKEFIVNDNIKEIVIFYFDISEVIKVNNSFTLKSKYKNIITIPSDAKGTVVDDKDPTQYPVN